MPKPLPFTEGAHRLLFEATRKALEFRSDVVLTEFILLALLEDKDRLVCKAFEYHGILLDELEERLRPNPRVDDERPEQYGPLLQSNRTKAVVEAASEVARRRRARRVTVTDIICALLGHNGAAAREYLIEWITAEDLAEYVYSIA